ncbi:LLM class F420-dependent oxidoreductase [Streptomyces ureilyticus]|uniref:LLM class F420-dependent oxidoreductase n=1 Tax=Streptomyces ureilyticus TaxID=1775131 RepID=A0ABX0DQ85_9ACTN|nr:LLM class F420-dependent oxidoreductase [Streptomyces ureilyticus]NGO43893.1 LLM class F420-dependent oxidoreductase [Streptomyces ureilyticus]
MATKLGLCLPQAPQYDIGRDVPDVARTAEQIGYESLWVYERALFPEPATQGLYGVPGLPWPPHYRSVPDALVTLTLAASATERVRLGTGVLVVPLHGPFQLAKTLGTLDAASGGRVVTGLGTGWSLDEYAAAGVAPFEERGRVLDEFLDVCQAVWGPDPVEYEGRLTKIAPSVVGPKPARPIPVLLPANSKKALTRLIDRADGWMPIAMGADQLAAQWQQVQDMASERGRTKPIATSVRVNGVQYTAKAYDGADRAPFQGNVEQIVTDLKAHTEIGLDEFFLDLQASTRDAQELKDVAAEVFTAARAAGI